MGTSIGIGLSQKLNLQEAAFEAARQARLGTQMPQVDLALIFSTVHYNPNEFLPIILDNLPETKVIGCSTAGIITSSLIATRGLAVLAISSDEAHFAVDAIHDIGSHDMRKAGNMLARNIVKDHGSHSRQAFIYFADGLLEDHSSVLKGLQDVFGTVFPIVGAGSSDDFHFKRTFQICQNRITANAVTGFLMGGHLTIGIGSRHGWLPLGKPRFVDKAQGNIIRTIDGKPAANIYDEN